MGWFIESPWRPKNGTGRTIAVTSGTLVTDTVACSADAVQVSVITGNTLVSVSGAASATNGVLVKTTDPPLILKCSPGDKLSTYGLATGTLYVIDVTP